MKKIVTIGGATCDIFLLVDTFEAFESKTIEQCQMLLMREGAKIDIDRIHYATGGGAINAAVSFATLGFQVSAFVKLGSDAHADTILKRLEQKKIAINYVRKAEGFTGLSCILPCPTGNRIILAYRGVNAYLTEQDISKHLFDDADCVYITSLSGDSAHVLPHIIKLAHASGCQIAINPGSSQLKRGASILRDNLSGIDILILNTYESSLLAFAMAEKDMLERNHEQKPTSETVELLQKGLCMPDNVCFSLSAYMKAVLKRGPQIVVVTNGKEGVYVGCSEGIYFCPSIPVKTFNTVGAGDAFGSCFVGALVSGYPLQQAMAYGVANAAQVIQTLDAQTGLSAFQELEKIVKNEINKVKFFEC